MVNFKDWKDYAKGALGGTIVLVGGSYLAPVVNQLITFIPAKDLFLGVTPHGIIAYGAAFLGAMVVNEKVIK